MEKVKPKKHLGQHFLTDLSIAENIAKAVTGHGGVKKVLEIGPGMGVLTDFLLKNPQDKGSGLGAAPAGRELSSGNGMNSSLSVGGRRILPCFQSSLACSILSLRDETKFHQINRSPNGSPPIIISVLTAVQTPGINVIGMTMLLQFVVSFGFILPVNAPQNMIAYGTDTFEARDFVRTGIVITLAAVVLLVVFALTYWPWLGLMVTRA